jgi:glycosyltransferase involved in cell wall biosynthesis
MPAELIVVDNGSQDGTSEVVKTTRLANLPVRYVMEPRRGQCFARNTGLAHSRGAIILFTDDDVRPPADWIAGMCLPILSNRAQAVTGGVRLAPHLQRSWMEPLHRGWLASTESIDAAAPYTMFGANMGFSREVLEKVPGFDTELGPGALGFGDEMLFSWQLLEAGYKLHAALDVEVEHHFEADRLLRRAFLQSARKRGRTQAYLDYHWRHREIAHAPRKHALGQARLWYWRLRRANACRNQEGCPAWECELVQRAEYFKSWSTELQRPRNYAPRGLVKKSV